MKTTSCHRPGGNSSVGHQRGARVAEFANTVGKPLAAEGGRRFQGADSSQELGPVGGKRARTTPYIGKGDPSGEVVRPGVSGQQSPLSWSSVQTTWSGA